MFDQQPNDETDFAKAKGHESFRRALEIAAGGGHNILML
ncbi:MAG: ATP-binding protein [Verrucomicrobiota bacterium]